jgi:hypothetical protein
MVVFIQDFEGSKEVLLLGRAQYVFIDDGPINMAPSKNENK